jgi:DNA-binding transcriptional MerR regulator
MEKSATALKTISEAAEILGVETHVLRFWEKQFPQIKPLKQRAGRRYYRPDDMAMLQEIKDLLYGQGFTIEGAKRQLRQPPTEIVQNETKPLQNQLEALHKELLAMREMISLVTNH